MVKSFSLEPLPFVVDRTPVQLTESVECVIDEDPKGELAVRGVVWRRSELEGGQIQHLYEPEPADRHALIRYMSRD